MQKSIDDLYRRVSILEQVLNVMVNEQENVATATATREEDELVNLLTKQGVITQLKNIGPKQLGTPLKIHYFKDGKAWRAVQSDFVNLQESPAGFGDTTEEAFDDLMNTLAKQSHDESSSDKERDEISSLPESSHLDIEKVLPLVLGKLLKAGFSEESINAFTGNPLSGVVIRVVIKEVLSHVMKKRE